MQLLVPLVLASVVLAAPKRSCDVSSAVVDVPANSTLTPPTHQVSFLALGVGTQNYTCTSAGNFASAGALAELFDVSCLYGTDYFFQIPSDAFELWEATPPGITIQSVVKHLPVFRTPLVLGEHFFVTNPITGSGINPKWDFTSRAFPGNPSAFMVGAKAAGIPAPTGPSDVDWLLLDNIAGSLADQVYRTDTRGGQPPSSCTPGSDPITVKYTSFYWLTGGSIKQ